MAAPSLYHATILDRDRHPRCHGPLPGATHQATLDNPLCGDIVTMRLVLAAPDAREPDAAPAITPDGGPAVGGAAGYIVAAAFEGRGCAVSRAAASLWAERIQRCTAAEIAALIDRFLRFVIEPAEAPLPEELGELAVLAGVRAAKSRRGCATLAARALAAALAAPASAPGPAPPPDGAPPAQ